MLFKTDAKEDPAEKTGFLGKPFKNYIFLHGIEIPLVFIKFSNFVEFSYISHTILILVNGFSSNWEMEAGSWKPEVGWWLASISWTHFSYNSHRFLIQFSY